MRLTLSYGKHYNISASAENQFIGFRHIYPHIEEWCRQHIQDYRLVDLYPELSVTAGIVGGYAIEFNNVSDMIAFKLRWL